LIYNEFRDRRDRASVRGPAENGRAHMTGGASPSPRKRRPPSLILYSVNMRKAISITLSEDNLLWLRGQAGRTPRGSVSEVLDRIVGEARANGRTDPGAVRSIVATIDLPDDDPDLADADGYIRSIFAESPRRPMVVLERSAKVRARKSRD
jgi:hypothetical protein